MINFHKLCNMCTYIPCIEFSGNTENQENNKNFH